MAADVCAKELYKQVILHDSRHLIYLGRLLAWGEGGLPPTFAVAN